MSRQTTPGESDLSSAEGISPFLLSEIDEARKGWWVRFWMRVALLLLLGIFLASQVWELNFILKFLRLHGKGIWIGATSVFGVWAFVLFGDHVFATPSALKEMLPRSTQRRERGRGGMSGQFLIFIVMAAAGVYMWCL
jgi:hypothetical protein